MKNYFFSIVTFILVASFVVGCANDPENANGQKEVSFSLSEKGSTSNWQVTDDISGTYFNIENIVDSTHNVTITPVNDFSGDEVDVSFKIGDEIVSTSNDKEQEVFTARKTDSGDYEIVQEGLHYFDDNETLMDEEVSLIITYGDQEDTVTLE